MTAADESHRDSPWAPPRQTVPGRHRDGPWALTSAMSAAGDLATAHSMGDLTFPLIPRPLQSSRHPPLHL